MKIAYLKFTLVRDKYKLIKAHFYITFLPSSELHKVYTSVKQTY